MTHFPLPGFDPPFAVALIELEEGVRLASNVVDVPPEEMAVGIPVEVTFEKVADDVTLPLFRRRR